MIKVQIRKDGMSNRGLGRMGKSAWDSIVTSCPCGRLEEKPGRGLLEGRGSEKNNEGGGEEGIGSV